MFNKLEARVLSEYKRSRAAPSTFCTLIKHYFSFIKHYIKHIILLFVETPNFFVLKARRRAGRVVDRKLPITLYYEAPLNRGRLLYDTLSWK
jgi:hypothetical protein